LLGVSRGDCVGQLLAASVGRRARLTALPVGLGGLMGRARPGLIRDALLLRQRRSPGLGSARRLLARAPLRPPALHTGLALGHQLLGALHTLPLLLQAGQLGVDGAAPGIDLRRGGLLGSLALALAGARRLGLALGSQRSLVRVLGLLLRLLQLTLG